MSLDRRSLLRGAAAAAAAPLFGSRAFAGPGAAQDAVLRPAIDMPLGQHGPKFKYSLAAYSYRALLQGETPPLSLFDFVEDCARLGLEGTELTSYYFPKDFDDSFLHRLKHACFRRGLSISGTAVGNDFGHPPGTPQRDQQIADLKTWIGHAATLGAPVIRVFAGHVKKGQDPEATHGWMVSALEECCEEAGRHGVHLAIENHGGPTATADGLLRFVEDVKSPWFGVNLDTGNFHTEDLYGDLARVAPHAVNVQVKVQVSGPDGVKRPSDYARLGGILREARYRGFVVLEYEEGGDPRAESARHLDALRTALGRP